jgi:hypothetical protein
LAEFYNTHPAPVNTAFGGLWGGRNAPDPSGSATLNGLTWGTGLGISRPFSRALRPGRPLRTSPARPLVASARLSRRSRRHAVNIVKDRSIGEEVPLAGRLRAGGCYSEHRSQDENNRVHVHSLDNVGCLNAVGKQQPSIAFVGQIANLRPIVNRPVGSEHAFAALPARVRPSASGGLTIRRRFPTCPTSRKSSKSRQRLSTR